MKRTILLVCFLMISLVALAKDNGPDPLYLSTPPLNPDDFKKEEKTTAKEP